MENSLLEGKKGKRLMLDSRVVDVRMVEFIPIKPLAATGSSAPGSCAGHSRVPSPDGSVIKIVIHEVRRMQVFQSKQ